MSRALRDLLSILRVHIILIAVTGAVVFGWLLGGRYLLGVALLGGVDWMLINLFNRTTDLAEDQANRIRGTDVVARHRTAFLWACAAVLVGSFALSHWRYPELTWLRAILLGLGGAYSHPILPSPGGWRRIKDLYFFKNLMSATGFVITCFLYPLAHLGWRTELPGGWPGVATLIVFFLALEVTYEILYDLRDVEGDRAAGVPTYPVVHGVRRARQIIDGLLLFSGAVLAGALLAGFLGVREGLMLAAPVVQFFFYRSRLARGLTTADCVWLTHLGTALLLLYLAGNWAWLRAGLPPNLYL